MREGTRLKIGPNPLAAGVGIDSGDTLGERPRCCGLLERQGPIAPQQRLDRFAEPRPELDLAGDRPPRHRTDRAGFEHEFVAELDRPASCGPR